MGKAARPNKNKIKLSDTMFLCDIVVKTNWIYANLCIDIKEHPYLGAWCINVIPSSIPFELGKEASEKIIIPIKKKKKDWDKLFWEAALDSKIPLDKQWKEIGPIAKERREIEENSKAEQEEEERIFQRNW